MYGDLQKICGVKILPGIQLIHQVNSEKEMFNRFSKVIDERKSKQLKSETTLIGFKSIKILEFKKIENIYKVTVNFVSEIMTCVKDKNNQIIEGNPDTIKTVNDVWRFAKNMWSQDPTWYLVDTSSKQ